MERWQGEILVIKSRISLTLAISDIINVIMIIKTLHFQSFTDRRSEIKHPIYSLFPSGLIPPREGLGGRRQKD